MSSITVFLKDKDQAKIAMAHAYRQAAPALIDGKRMVLTIKEETRRDNHNRHFHSLIGQIADKVRGDLESHEDAKRILISAFRIETCKDPDLADEWEKFGDVRMGRGLHREVVLLGMQSRDFTIKLARAFITWLYAFGAEHDVQFKLWGDER